jgi:molybdate transport system permease protein
MTYSPDDLTALAISLKLAFITTLLLLIIGLPIAWWLNCTKSKFKFAIEAIIGLPLVLPPTVLGFYLLMALGNQTSLGRFLESLFGRSLAFSFTGLVIGSMIYSLPFVVRPLQSSFASIGKRPLEVAATLGASPLSMWWHIILPMSRPGILTACILGFAHTIGEFGVVLMIGGNIPGETKVLSMAIYEHVETLKYDQAHALSLGLLILSFLSLFTVFIINKRLSVLKT